MISEIKVENIKCECVPYEKSDRVVYMIYPALVPFSHEWLHATSEKFGVSIVAVYIPADGWNDMLTPWAEPGETKDAPPFGGKSAETLKYLQEKIVPSAEKTLGKEKISERDLVGVSLSGLFTLWQWLGCSTFDSIGCISGSFWYPGFMDWFDQQTLPDKKGKAVFLLGDKEPKAWIKAYRSVGVNTEAIVEKLRKARIDVSFTWVPGNHFADPVGRASLAVSSLMSQ